MRVSPERLRVPGTAALALALLAAILAGAPLALAARPAADCQPYAGRACLFPFPDNRLTRTDRSSRTGVRLRLPAGAMPVNTKGQRIAIAPYNRNDGFSPGSDVVLHVPGLDNQAAMNRTGAVPLVNMARAFAPRQPIVIIDEATGRRQLIWSELDANASRAATTDLIIHPGKNFTEGHTYIVALRNLRTASGRLIAAPSWFRPLRAGSRLPGAERAQRARYARIFSVLARVGIAQSSLYAAWDFTVASTPDLTGRMLAIRNAAFAQLGDTNLADGHVTGHAPAFQISSVTTLNAVAGVNGPMRSVQGTFSIPCYLVTCGASTATGFHYRSTKPDAVPTQIPGNVATAPFECLVPSSASAATPARISLYGHGLLGSHAEIEATNVQDMASEHNMVFCATDFWGLAKGDTPNDAAALVNVSLFPNAVDRLQQGVLNTLVLGRLMLNPQGLAANPSFQTGGRPLIDTGNLYYDGNSQGGIMGG